VSTFFLDTSALVKRYALEIGTDWVASICDPASGHTVLVAEITLVEVAAALAAKARIPGGLTAPERDAALSAFLDDCGHR
jgi:hypothetical protein